jgi:hypothetical protein
MQSHKELTRMHKDNLDKFIEVIESLEKKYKNNQKTNMPENH